MFFQYYVSLWLELRCHFKILNNKLIVPMESICYVSPVLSRSAYYKYIISSMLTWMQYLDNNKNRPIVCKIWYIDPIWLVLTYTQRAASSGYLQNWETNLRCDRRIRGHTDRRTGPDRFLCWCIFTTSFYGVGDVSKGALQIPHQIKKT